MQVLRFQGSMRVSVSCPTVVQINVTTKSEFNMCICFKDNIEIVVILIYDLNKTISKLFILLNYNRFV